ASRLEIEPAATVNWLRDINGNSIAVITFLEPAAKMSVVSEVEVDLYEEAPIEGLIESYAQTYPFQYAPEEQVEIVPYRLPSYPHDGPALRRWLLELYQPGQVVDTWVLLNNLNTRIYEAFDYNYREEFGVQLPCETLAKKAGSCRDYAVFMMEAARHWGFAARFVTGYVQMAEGQHGATHAWTEVYVPGAGWRGFDPTNNKPAGSEHISVAVSREQEKASPLAGFWEGASDAFDRMEVSVQVVAEWDSTVPVAPPVDAPVDEDDDPPDEAKPSA
ncbi:MAG: transglutaminase-like domain-containing protein, partial [Planctomycetia bacterium]